MLPHLASEAGGMMLSCPPSSFDVASCPSYLVVRQLLNVVATCFFLHLPVMCDHDAVYTTNLLGSVRSVWPALMIRSLGSTAAPIAACWFADFHIPLWAIRSHDANAVALRVRTT